MGIESSHKKNIEDEIPSPTDDTIIAINDEKNINYYEKLQETINNYKINLEAEPSVKTESAKSVNRDTSDFRFLGSGSNLNGVLNERIVNLYAYS